MEKIRVKKEKKRSFLSNIQRADWLILISKKSSDTLNTHPLLLKLSLNFARTIVAFTH